MNNPQLENGYLKIANSIWEALGKYRLSGEEWLILNCVLRKTYGFNKKQDHISLSQFSEYTGLKRASAVRAIKKLVAKKLLGSSKSATSLASIYSFNKQFTEWTPSSKKATTSSSNTATKGSSNNATHKRHIKNNIKNISTKVDSLKTQTKVDNRNPEVLYILDTYKKLLDQNPIDHYPYRVAYNFRQSIMKMRRLLEGTAYNKTYEQTIEGSFAWYMRTCGEFPGKTISVVYRNVKSLLIPAVLRKYDKQSGVPVQKKQD